MRLRAIILVSATVALIGCQPAAKDDEAAFTSAPAPEAPAAEDAATDADSEGAGPADEPAQQTAPPPATDGDMGSARSSEESVEPDSPTMFQ